MFQESFEVSVKKGKKVSKAKIEEDEGSEIEDDDIIVDDEDELEVEITEILSNAFSEVAEVLRVGFREYSVDFFEPNTKLIEDDAEYDFDIRDDVPVLEEAEYFIPFVNFLKNHEPGLTGITLNTNLEGGGHLVI